MTTVELIAAGKPFQLLTIDNDAKTSKGRELGYLTGILYLAPAWEAGLGINLCPMATDGCMDGCLFKSGRASFDPSIIEARIARTQFLFNERERFIQYLIWSIKALIRQAKREGLIPAVRVNGTSDLAWLSLLMAKLFPGVQFYDYTKLNRAWERTRANYHLTFSHSESNDAECERALEHGLNVAMVFDTKRKGELPSEYMGRQVIDGDKHDLRFLEGYQGVIIGLRAKGPAKEDKSGFVVRDLVQIQVAA